MILEALMKIFNDDNDKAQMALTMIIALVEEHGRDYGCRDGLDEEHAEVYFVLLNHLERENRG